MAQPSNPHIPQPPKSPYQGDRILGFSENCQIPEPNLPLFFHRFPLDSLIFFIFCTKSTQNCSLYNQDTTAGVRAGNCPWLCKIDADSILCNLSVGYTRFYRIDERSLRIRKSCLIQVAVTDKGTFNANPVVDTAGLGIPVGGMGV